MKVVQAGINEYLEKIVEKTDKNKNKLLDKSKRFSFYRLFVFLAGVVLSITLYFIIGIIYFWISAALFITVFGIITTIHNKIIDGIRRHFIWLDIKKTHLARIKLKWDKIPKINSLFPEPGAVEVDLNLTGEQSLHHLINTSVTEGGSNFLREWLCNLNPTQDEITKRQLLIKELTPLSRFRDKLILFSSFVSKNEFKEDKLMDWLNSKSPIKNLNKLLLALSFLAPVNLLLIVLNFFGFIPAFWLISSFIYSGIYMYYVKYLKGTLDDAVAIYDELRKLYKIITFLESYRYNNNQNLKELCAPFLSKDKPSVQLNGIKKIISSLQMRGNPAVWLAFAVLFPVDFFYANKLEKYKSSISEKLPLWLETWYKLEALNSLANFAYLNPDYQFPALNNSTGSHNISIAFKKAGHPLIPSERKICNDFSLKNAGEIALITGSNMSGKSTFLRTIGINVCLAYSGGPVNAQSMDISLFRLFTCIKVSDSVIDGISYFYSEVKRLKLLLDELNKNDERPVLFLIDEIFKGTNNFERLEGSKSYIKYLAGKNGTGIISTHDLELIRIADELKQFRNYHFREEVINNKMEFDYLLREGPCPTTNALKIMKMEGLPVDDELLKEKTK